MLILSRRLQETIRIGDEITIQLLSMQGGYIRVGITAPKNISIHREEIYNLIQAAKQDKKPEGKENIYSEVNV
ncbi:MAG: carbon storage regulator CsrA [Gammaproteobacteria bacterium]